MRFKLLFICLLMVCLAVACSNKNSNEPASPAANNAQPNQPAAPAASSETGNGTAATTTPAPGAAPTAAPLVIPAGTNITVRLANSISSGTAQSGDSFAATVADPIRVGGQEVVATGARAEGTVAEAHARGKIKGAASLRLELTRLTINGTGYPVRTSMAGFAQKGKGKRTAVAAGGGAALGGIIGAIAGGGKGAGIGLLAGGAAGLAGGTLTGNKQIDLPAETALTFKLKDSVTLK